MKVITGEGRLSYCHIWDPISVNGGKEKYSTSYIFPKSDTETLRAIQAGIKAAYEDGQGVLRGKGRSVPPLSGIKTPLHDGDKEKPDDEAYRNSYYIQASSLTRPGVVDANVQKIINPEEVYSGCYARLSLGFYAYNVNGNKGIGAGLNNVQKLRDGEHLGGTKSSPEEDFGTGAVNEGFEDDLFN